MANPIVQVAAAALFGGAFLLKKIGKARREESERKQAEMEEVGPLPAVLRTGALRESPCQSSLSLERE